MADIDREKFAIAAAKKLRALGIPGERAASRAFPAIKTCTWSRMGNFKPLSAGNTAAICKVLDLDIREFVDLDARNSQDMHAKNREWKQRVARHVSHETGVAQ